MMRTREFGILMHPSSLPSPHGIGDFGLEARLFVDWLSAVGARIWQILPLVPPGAGNSPYSTWSAFSGNPMLIDLDELVHLNLLPELEIPAGLSRGAVHFDAVAQFKTERLNFAAENFLKSPNHPLREEFDRFVQEQEWVLDAALFTVLKANQDQKPWWAWPAELKDRVPDAMNEIKRELDLEIRKFCVLQYFFDVQWRSLRAYCTERGVEILGDMPIYVDADSVDVWCNRVQFQLDEEGLPKQVAGVPPDAFSETGQLWGNPLYDWDHMQSDGFQWWIKRLERGFALTDRVRIDHFRGLSAYWSVPSDAIDARSGTWIKGPGQAFFEAMEKALGTNLPIVAEDLGTIDADVVALVKSANVPNMLVLQFAFGDTDDNWYLPHQHGEKSVVYTGTHDNNTTVGWWHDASDKVMHHVRTYFGTDGHDIAWILIRAALSSVAQTAIIPVQDVMSLGAEGRMNTPSVGLGNWGWRLTDFAHLYAQQNRLKDLAQLYSRTS